MIWKLEWHSTYWGDSFPQCVTPTLLSPSSPVPSPDVFPLRSRPFRDLYRTAALAPSRSREPILLLEKADIRRGYSVIPLGLVAKACKISSVVCAQLLVIKLVERHPCLPPTKFGYYTLLYYKWQMCTFHRNHCITFFHARSQKHESVSTHVRMYFCTYARWQHTHTFTHTPHTQANWVYPKSHIIEHTPRVDPS